MTCTGWIGYQNALLPIVSKSHTGTVYVRIIFVDSTSCVRQISCGKVSSTGRTEEQEMYIILAGLVSMGLGLWIGAKVASYRRLSGEFAPTGLVPCSCGLPHFETWEHANVSCFPKTKKRI
jgi:hypothetical protein